MSPSSKMDDVVSEASDPTRATLKGGVPHYMGLAGSNLIFAITCTATSAFLLFGYDQGVMSGIISAPQFFRVFPDLNPENVGSSHASTMQAFYTAIYEIGCLFGAIFALFFGNKLGRRRNILIGACFVTVGTIIQITSMPGHLAGHQFVIGRTVTGFGNGLNTATVPSWQAECSKAQNRGLHIFVEASMIAVGTVTAYWIDFGLSYVDSSLSWRLPIGMQIIFAIILVVGILLLPESPRYLLSTGQDAEGQLVVAALANEPVNSEYTQQEKRVIVEALTALGGELRISDVLTGGPSQHFRRTAIGASSQLFQQIGGCNAVIYFAPVIFQQYIGLDRRLALILGGVNSTVYALSSFLSYPMIERLGRRKMFLWGTVGQAASMFLAMGCLIPYNVYNDTENKATYGAVAGLFLFLTAFGSTWLGLPWLLPAEINPNAIRTNANAISTIHNWLYNFAVVMWTPPMLDKWGGFGTFLFFGIINLTFIPFIYAYYPETKGRSLEEIDVIFAKAYTQGEWYVKVANEMPKLTAAEVESEARRWGLAGDVEVGGGYGGDDSPQDKSNEKAKL